MHSWLGGGVDFTDLVVRTPFNIVTKTVKQFIQYGDMGGKMEDPPPPFYI